MASSSTAVDSTVSASNAKSQPISVLFVCLGNICRSPMAEGVFRHVVLAGSTKSRIAQVDSAGTGAYHTGDSPDSRTMLTLKSNGIKGYKHGARKITAKDFEIFDYVLVMDKMNLEDVKRSKEKLRTKFEEEGKRIELAKVMLFGDFGGTAGEEIGDPYYGAKDGFKICYQQLLRFTQGFVQKVLVDAKPEDVPSKESLA